MLISKYFIFGFFFYWNVHDLKKKLYYGLKNVKIIYLYIYIW